MGKWRHSFILLNLDTKWRGVARFTLPPIYSKERAPSTHWIGGWVGPRAGLEASEKKKSCTAVNRFRAVEPVAISTVISLSIFKFLICIDYVLWRIINAGLFLK
jgi:hypothetical protein